MSCCTKWWKACMLAGWLAGIVLAVQGAAAAPLHLTVDGQERGYLLYRPPGLRKDVPAALVIMLHGGFGSASQARSAYGWDALADREGFVLAYPDGIGHSWNAGGICCGPALKRDIDDVGYLDHLIATVAEAENIDAQRIYLTGMSNGAAMAYRYACEGQYPLAAIGPVAGTLSFACAHAHAVSVLAIHGADDAHVPLAGGAGTKGVTQGRWQPVEATLDRWRAADHCDPGSTAVETPVATESAHCAQGRDVVLITIAGAGHQWPGSARKGLLQQLLGGDPPSSALDATARLWAFFRAHPAPP